MPLFFGLLESLCFLCLFCSPLFSPTDAPRIWLAVALLRAVVLAVVLLPGRDAPQSVRCLDFDAASFLGKGLLYQAPFWLSALFFPLQSGQFQSAFTALVVQIALLPVLFLLTRWGGLLGAESLVFLLSLAWLLIWRVPGLWLGTAALSFLMTCRVPWCRRGWGWTLGFGNALSIGFAWLGVFVFPLLGSAVGPSIGAMLLCWLLLVYLGAVMTALQRESSINDEVEAALPQGGNAGRAWLLRRRSAVVTFGWMALAILVVRSAQECIALALVASSWWRAAELGARRWFNLNRSVWWTASEITALWIAHHGSVQMAGALALASAFFAAILGLTQLGAAGSQADVEEAAGLSRLDGVLVNGLHQPAPPGFATRVLADTESVELDKDLAAAAPAGFRERLMRRLRQADEEKK